MFLIDTCIVAVNYVRALLCFHVLEMSCEWHKQNYINKLSVRNIAVQKGMSGFVNGVNSGDVLMSGN